MYVQSMLIRCLIQLTRFWNTIALRFVVVVAVVVDLVVVLFQLIPFQFDPLDWT